VAGPKEQEDLMDSYCVEVDDLDGLFVATVTDGSGQSTTATSYHSGFDAARDALGALMPEPEAVTV